MVDDAGIRLLRLVGLGDSTMCTTALPSEYIQAPGKAKFGRGPFSRPMTVS